MGVLGIQPRLQQAVPDVDPRIEQADGWAVLCRPAGPPGRPSTRAASVWESMSSNSTARLRASRSRLPADQRDEWLNAFLSVCRWTTIYYGWRPNLRDEGDNHLIELAVAGSASAVVTKNARDFRSAELQFPGLRILLPEDVLKEIDHGHPDHPPAR